MLVPRSRRARAAAAVTVVLATFGAAAPADARITRLDVQVVESPTFEGRSFGAVGTYEKLAGRAYGEVDPRDPGNAVITDIPRAPRNARGMVEYATDVWLVRPVDAEKGSRKVFFELNNRGSNLSFGQMLDATTGGNDPKAAGDAGNGYLMRAGHTILQTGWDATAAPGDGRFTLTVPVARRANGRSITGPSLEEFVIDTPSPAAQAITYAPVSLDEGDAELTWRLRYDDPPQPVPAADWAFAADGKSVSLARGAALRVGLYELAYEAKDPIVAGLGFAAIRDVGSFLRGADEDANGTPNPLAGDIDRIYSFGVSQPARTMHDFVRLGFNADEDGERVFDGVLNWIGGATGIFMNHRFAQPFRTHRQHIGRWFPEYEFPFANQPVTDPYTGQTAGRLDRCRASDTCPKIFEVNSENEYWAKAMSVGHTDLLGRDLPDAEGVRDYHMAALPHSAGSGPTGPGICQQSRNPLVANTVLRGLLVALDEWVVDRREPPASRLPRRADGTMTRPLPQWAVGFPSLPGVIYNGVAHTGDRFDYGPRFERGILDRFPPRLVDSPYPVYVPTTDRDGNGVAGVRVPDVAVPLATYTGWNLRRSGDGCDAAGMVIPFARTREERERSGDPRPSMAERYPSQAAYVRAVSEAAEALVRDRFLLREDADAYVRRAEATPVGG